METNTGPGKADAQSGDLAALRRQFAEFGEVQAKQSQTLDIITGKFNKLERASSEHRSRLFVLEAGLQGFREEMSGKFERLDNSVTWLKGQFTSREGVLIGLSEEMNGLRDGVAVLKTDVSGLRDGVAVLKTDVSGLRDGVAVLKTDVSELKDNVTVLEVKVDQLQADMADVKGSLKEILNRLPAKAA
jgi:chromosome segregation ATPase